MRAIVARWSCAAAAAALLVSASPAGAQEPGTSDAARIVAVAEPDGAATGAVAEAVSTGDADEVRFGAIPPLGGLGMRLGGVGAWTDRGEVDDELVGAGHAPLSSSRLGPMVGFHVQITRLELGIEVMAVGDWSTQAAIDRPSHHHSAVFGTARYAVVRLGPLALGPSLGLGAARSEVCVAGPSRPRQSPGDTAFRQVLLDAGRESCLSTDTAVLRPGLAADVTFWTDPGPDEPRLGFGAGLRAGAMIPLGGDSRWTLDLGDSRLGDLEGPAAPAGGWYVGLDVGFAFGLGRDD